MAQHQNQKPQNQKLQNQKPQNQAPAKPAPAAPTKPAPAVIPPAEGETKTPRVKKAPDLRPIPVWQVDGMIVDTKLKGNMFPRTRDGYAAYADFKAACWTAKAVRIRAAADPAQRTLQKIEKYQKMIKLLQAEMEAAAAASAAE